MIHLSKRLQCIADFISGNAIVADIGTDHGMLPCYLVQNKNAKCVIATDISELSLNKTVFLANRCKLEECIQCRVGDGLSTLRPYETDTVVIAGMGGVLISEIIEGSPLVAESILVFILQPMTADAELRQYLFSHGFSIEDEKLIYDMGKFYHTMKVMKKPVSVKYDNPYVSPFWEKNDCLHAYLKHGIIKQESIIQGLKQARNLDDVRLSLESERLYAYKKMLLSFAF